LWTQANFRSSRKKLTITVHNKCASLRVTRTQFTKYLSATKTFHAKAGDQNNTRILFLTHLLH